MNKYWCVQKESESAFDLAFFSTCREGKAQNAAIPERDVRRTFPIGSLSENSTRRRTRTDEGAQLLTNTRTAIGYDPDDARCVTVAL